MLLVVEGETLLDNDVVELLIHQRQQRLKPKSLHHPVPLLVGASVKIEEEVLGVRSFESVLDFARLDVVQDL